MELHLCGRKSRHMEKKEVESSCTLLSSVEAKLQRIGLDLTEILWFKKFMTELLGTLELQDINRA